MIDWLYKHPEDVIFVSYLFIVLLTLAVYGYYEVKDSHAQ